MTPRHPHDRGAGLGLFLVLIGVALVAPMVAHLVALGRL